MREKYYSKIWILSSCVSRIERPLSSFFVYIFCCIKYWILKGHTCSSTCYTNLKWDTLHFCWFDGCSTCTCISLDILLQRAGNCTIGLLKLRPALSTFELKGNTFCCSPAEKRADILLSHHCFPIWGLTGEIPHWWCVTTLIWVVLLIGHCCEGNLLQPIWSTTKFWAVTSVVVPQVSSHGGTNWWLLTLAVFSG